MVIKKNIFGFTSIRYILEPAPDVEVLKKKFSAISILLHTKLDLPGFSVREKKTPIIDLSKDLDDIFKKFNDTTRNEIRRSEKNPELHFINEDKNFHEAYCVYSGHEKSQGRVPEKKSEFVGTLVFSAYYKAEMISTVICFTSPHYLRAKTISSQRMENNNKEMLKIMSFATRRIMWEICKYAKVKGYKGFDLGVIVFDEISKKNLAQFKSGFSGEIYDEYLYTYKSTLYDFFEKVVKTISHIKRFFITLKKV